ncbi:MAG: ABC transporter ATP-binding protein [Candidatus Marinimicrobia bacterium]|nr:ABC transporter ATP-binding protein [Candidatus Neomarinimicrobiota bacterium]
MILDGIVTSFVFFNSPFKKAYARWRDAMYRRMRDLRGDEIAMIFQEPMTSLNPVYTVGFQIIESLKPLKFRENIKNGIINLARNLKSTPMATRIKTSLFFAFLVMIFTQLVNGWTFEIVTILLSLLKGAVFPSIVALVVIGLDKLISKEYRESWNKLFDEGVKLLDTVGIPSPRERMGDYPHQFSGGMRQRAMIAMALAKNPSLLIADEPTTALDVTIQAQILELMIELKEKKTDAAVVLITHDLAVVAETCERVIVMYGGRIQEVASAEELFENPLHPYTHGLLKSIPRPDKETKKERLEIIDGMVPSILDMPVGCKFCTRCDVKLEKCDTDEPLLIEVKDGHFVRCHVVAEKLEAK